MRKENIWWRGENCNFLPFKSSKKDPISYIENYILPGFLPEYPFINKEHGITVFGSCFAAEIYGDLKNSGYNVDPLKNNKDKPYHTHVTYHQSSMVNTHSILQQFLWAYEGKQFPHDLWQDKPGIIESQDEEIAKNTKLLFDNTDIFIMTLGLSELWIDKKSNESFWRAIPEDSFDPEKHEFRIASFQETKDNLLKIINTIRKYKPNACIIFTLSPIRLLATFRPIACLPANCVSKAILRVAIDESLRENKEDKNIFYWPSYEIMTEAFLDPWDEDNRHPIAEVHHIIIDLFKKYYLLKE